MPGPDFLERFRPSAAPGPAARVGVPSQTPDTEVLSVLAGLDATQRETVAIRERADEQVRRIVTEADDEVRRLQDRARLRSAEEREQAMAEALAVGRRDQATTLELARAQADRITALADAERPEVVRRAVAEFMQRLGLAGGDQPVAAGPR